MIKPCGTVSPGTTQRVKTMLERSKGWMSGLDFDLVCASERILEGKAIVSLESMPKSLGALDESGFEPARAFLMAYVRSECIQLTPVEAELASWLRICPGI